MGNDPLNKTDPDGQMANFVVKFAVDVALEITIQAATGQDIDVGSALKESAKGIVNPAKTAQKIEKLAKIVSKVEKTASGKRVEDYTRSQKNAAKAANAERNGGKMKCEDCGKQVENVKSEKGVPTPDNQAQVHHEPSIESGGTKETSKPIVLCPPCHNERHK